MMQLQRGELVLKGCCGNHVSMSRSADFATVQEWRWCSPHLDHRLFREMKLSSYLEHAFCRHPLFIVFYLTLF